MKRKVYGVLVVVCIILVFGVQGNIDQDLTPLGIGVLSILGFSIGAVVFGFLYNLEVKRDGDSLFEKEGEI